MSYTIIEQQTNDQGNNAILVHTPQNPQDDQEAESIYHLTLGSAAISNIYIHSVSLLNSQGRCLKYEYFIHNQSNDVE